MKSMRCSRPGVRLPGRDERLPIESCFITTLKWSPPSQTIESPEVSIGCYPFAARLDGKRGEPGICYQVSGGFRGNAQCLENRPVTFLRNNQGRVGTL